MPLMPVTQINTDKLKLMVRDWQAQAAARAMAVKKLRDRVAEGKGKGRSFTAEEVSAALALVAEFYEMEGRVKMLESLLSDLEGGKPEATPGNQRDTAGVWRLPIP